MPRTFLVAAPHSVPELSENEEQHEIGEFIEHEGFDFRGYFGEALIEDRWHTLWSFGSVTEAERFIREWGGVQFDEAKATDFRGFEMEPPRTTRHKP